MPKMLLLIAALATASPGLAAQPATAQAPVSVPAANALELAQLMSPRDMLIEMEVREFDKHFVSSMRADPELKSLDETYPGLFDAMHMATRSLVAKSTGTSVDRIHESVARLISDRFTAADIAELKTFYLSPLGQKTLKQMTASADSSDLYKRAISDPDAKLTQEDVQKRTRESARKTASSFTPAEQTEMILFMARPSFSKLAQAQTAIQKILVDAFNAPDPEFEKNIEGAMEVAVEQHIAKFPADDGRK